MSLEQKMVWYLNLKFTPIPIKRMTDIKTTAYRQKKRHQTTVAVFKLHLYSITEFLAYLVPGAFIILFFENNFPPFA